MVLPYLTSRFRFAVSLCQVSANLTEQQTIREAQNTSSSGSHIMIVIQGVRKELSDGPSQY